jgi:LmbE family N-acetylglucosaminyl deacetylase
VTATVLSPHLDDAVLSCWHLLEDTSELIVVNVFTGSPAAGTPAPWWDQLTGAGDPVERMEERRAEDRRALALVGRAAVSLDFLDAQYGRAHLPASELVRRLGAVVEPGTVIHAPAGLSRHPDHEVVRDAALELARAGWPLVVYADLPHAIAHGWPAWVTGPGRARALGEERAGAAEPATHGGPETDVGAEWTRLLSWAELAVEQLVPRVRALDGQARKRKLRALAEYRTQRAALDGLSFVPLEDPRALAFEVSWAVPRSALGGAHERVGQPLVADPGGELLDNRG